MWLQLTFDCKMEMFRADVENADDLRLSARLFNACLAEKRQFCAEIAPGNGRAKDCLEENMNKPNFGSGCKCAPHPMPYHHFQGQAWQERTLQRRDLITGLL